jgi:hypothetical protein
MQTPGDSKMRKGALLLAMLMLATAPTVAFAAKKKAAPKPKVYSTTAANMNESSARLVRDGAMQFFVPTQSNLKWAQAGAAPKAATPKKAKKGKKAKKSKKGKAKKK